ncbi:unnamed protein product [Pylaiella littoralis]
MHQEKIDSTSYTIDFKTGTLLLLENFDPTDSITINYLKYPQFLTRDYFTFDPKLIIENTGSIDRLYSLEQGTDTRTFKPFDGLNTVGSISRGVTIGNNQNAVVNSELDLQITGKLSDKVSIRASIQDANIPTQQGGYSQSLDEFDQIFIELYSDMEHPGGRCRPTEQQQLFWTLYQKGSGNRPRRHDKP